MNKIFVRKSIVALCIFIFPSRILPPILRFFGHCVSSGINVGFSLIWADKIALDQGVKIGHFNFIMVRNILLRNGAEIGRLNIVHGPLDIHLSCRACIGNSNKILRAKVGIVTVGMSVLRLGYLTKITSKHYIDCTCSVVFKDYSILAGIGSQIWTHGYVHEISGPDRYRIDGGVYVGSNCYVGSLSIINSGIRICDGVIIGSGVVVSKNISESGLYVSAAVRKLPRPENPDNRSNLKKINCKLLCERVYKRVD
jgi:acetyltransferase-like isoleucine patch superfamily enzyme